MAAIDLLTLLMLMMMMMTRFDLDIDVGCVFVVIVVVVDVVVVVAAAVAVESLEGDQNEDDVVRGERADCVLHFSYQFRLIYYHKSLLFLTTYYHYLQE